MKFSKKELRQKCNAATPGPYHTRSEAIDYQGMGWVSYEKKNGFLGPVVFEAYSRENALFFEAANPATVLALLDALEKAEKVIFFYAECGFDFDADTGRKAEIFMKELREVVSE